MHILITISKINWNWVAHLAIVMVAVKWQKITQWKPKYELARWNKKFQIEMAKNSKRPDKMAKSGEGLSLQRTF